MRLVLGEFFLAKGEENEKMNSTSFQGLENQKTSKSFWYKEEEIGGKKECKREGDRERLRAIERESESHDIGLVCLRPSISSLFLECHVMNFVLLKF